MQVAAGAGAGRDHKLPRHNIPSRARERRETSAGLELEGGYSTPWPDREPLSGAGWTSPEGEPVMVPYIDTAATLTGGHTQ